jgi:hypothetical protein
MNAKRGLTMHVLLLIFFIILLIWYVPHTHHTHTQISFTSASYTCATPTVCVVLSLLDCLPHAGRE